MRILGKEVDARLVEVVVIPRQGVDDFIFSAAPVTSEQYEIFEKLCPQPQPGLVIRPGQGKPEPDLEDASYVSAIDKWAGVKLDYMFYTSLQATEGLEWDTVLADDPSTWSNVKDELLGSGFVENEVMTIFNAVISANGLDQKKIEVATQDFLAIRAAQKS